MNISESRIPSCDRGLKEIACIRFTTQQKKTYLMPVYHILKNNNSLPGTNERFPTRRRHVKERRRKWRVRENHLSINSTQTCHCQFQLLTLSFARINISCIASFLSSRVVCKLAITSSHARGCNDGRNE